MGGSTTSTTNTNSAQMNEIPQWVNDAGQQNYAFAQNVATQPLQQYQGQMVADISPQQQQAWNLAAASGNVGQQALQASQAGYLNALAQQPTAVNAQTIAGTNLQPYMNPYTQDVINATLPIMQEQLGINQIGNQSQAAGAGAYGGSRQAIQQGVTQAQGALGMGQMAAQLNQANFGQALGAAQYDVGQQNNVALANQAAMQAKINSDINASAGLAQTGLDQSQANAAQYAMLSSAGAGEQQYAQDQINAQMAKFQQAYSYPQTQLGLLESSLGMTPYPTASSGSSTQQTTTESSPDFASLALGGLNTLGNLFKPAMVPSDERVKKNIGFLGRDPMTGVGIHSFNYRGERRGAPKTIGPLAQELERRRPGSTVRDARGIMHVPREILAAATPSAAGLPQHAANVPSPGLPPSSPGVAVAIGALGRPGAGRRPRVMGGLGA